MGQTEPKPFWGWCIKGFGGVLNIAEGFMRDGIAPSKNQMEMLEYQLSRLTIIFDTFANKPNRTKEDILTTRGFGMEDVLDFSVASFDGCSLSCDSTGEEVDAGLLTKSKVVETNDVPSRESSHR